MGHWAASGDIHTDLADYYRDHGYLITRGLVPLEAIDRLLAAYARDILPSKRKFYRQSTDRYESNRVTPFGYVAQSFLDIHAYRTYPEFRQAALEIFFAEVLQRTLTEITDSDMHNLMQSMLFDANTETPPHQDWWYLDSVPNGQLLAAWIAMEDIEEEAGRFFVVPDSHRLVLHDQARTMPHSQWLARVRQYCDEHKEQLHAPDLKKGDVLFWNSRTIHGSLPTVDKRYSRKSLTAHFLPAALRFGNLFTSKPWVRYEHHGVYLHFANQPEYSLKSALVSKLKVTLYDHPQLLKWARKFQRGGVSDY